MRIARRTFLKSVGLGSLAGLGLGACAGAGSGPRSAARAKSGRPLLILGGTGFLGPALVDAARARGHKVTLFNRGKTNPQLFPDVEKLHGDRDGHLEALEGRKWDAVLDTSGYVPRLVTASAELLAPGVQQYLFISTISVFSDNSIIGMDENAPVGKLDPKDAGTEKVTGETYGPLKALCEHAAEAAMPGRATVIRPGLIVGPLDPTDRFTYWPVRVAGGGEVLAPGNGSDPVQIIDVRDLAEFCILAVEQRVTGTFNATGPASELTMSGMLDGCKTASGSDARFTWADTKFLEAQKVSPWSDMPVWVPAEGEDKGFARVSAKKAIARGLRFRPIVDTARDTLAWWRTLPEERRQKPMRAGITAQREAEILRLVHERGNQRPAG
jgi:nucleoside-diphosphate-sugar epimerase